jgi:hypothetical protein
MGGLRLERDPRFPVRVTVQFYRATSNGVIDEQDLVDVKRQIDRVYEDGDFVGSLVVPEDGRTRPTEWQRIRRQWLSGVMVPPVVTPVVTPVVYPVTPVVQPVTPVQPIPYVTHVNAPSLPFFARLPGTAIPFDPVVSAFVSAFVE